RYTDSAVQPGMTYWYVVKGVDRSGLSGATSKEVSATVPSAGPAVISGVVPLEVSPVSARIVWSTNEPATSRVDWGLTPALGGSVSDATMVMEHSLILTGLQQGTLYHYQVSSVDFSGFLTRAPV